MQWTNGHRIYVCRLNKYCCSAEDKVNFVIWTIPGLLYGWKLVELLPRDFKNVWFLVTFAEEFDEERSRSVPDNDEMCYTGWWPWKHFSDPYTHAELKNAGSDTSLIIAVCHGKLQGAKYILRRGADPLAKDDNRQNSLYLAHHLTQMFLTNCCCVTWLTVSQQPTMINGWWDKFYSLVYVRLLNVQM